MGPDPRLPRCSSPRSSHVLQTSERKGQRAVPARFRQSRRALAGETTILHVGVMRGVRLTRALTHAGPCHRRSPSPLHLANLRCPQLVPTPRLVPCSRLQALLLGLRSQPRRVRPSGPDRVPFDERVLHAKVESWRATDRRGSHCKCPSCTTTAPFRFLMLAVTGLACRWKGRKLRYHQGRSDRINQRGDLLARRAP